MCSLGKALENPSKKRLCGLNKINDVRSLDDKGEIDLF